MLFLRSTILALLFSTVFLNTAQADSIPREPRVALQISPLALIDFYNGSSYKLGTTIRLTKSFFFSADFGGYFRNFNVYRNYKGFNSDFRIRYQFPDSYSGISINYFYKQQSFDYPDHLTDPDNTPIIVHTKKYVNCINFNYEHWIPFLSNERAYLTIIVGAGVRFRNVHSSLTNKHQFDQLKEGGDSQSLYFVLIPGQNTWLNFNAGLRLGFYLF